MNEHNDRTGMQRRNLLSGVAAGGVGAILAGVGGIPTAARAQTAKPSDEDILNFALNFEYLGAELYLHALTGSGLSAADTGGVGTPGSVLGGRAVAFSTDVIRQGVSKLAEDEVAHVRTLRTRLGALAIARPAINISADWWTAIAVAAGVVPAGQRFDPYADELSFVKAAYALEDVCVTALAGALPMFTNPADVATAGAFLAVEAAQASAIRVVLGYTGQGAYTDAISNLRAQLSGAPDDIGTSVPGNTVNFVSSSNGQVFTRTPAQVLNIAYGGGAVAGFGFFPNRVNGAIR
ncbi:ferritin-like domain-containing protein [Rhizosaccharibacter radicis]|uniref:Ferritin-like domain-containing protein n=1 Tax=Rhizosaccharibacter radicis TaxID=2782605 RepID=A0ABT1W091_9PROT|nr:ferritin-like domain-containing protein [Acetobacteraceae bacterium KSS12]